LDYNTSQNKVGEIINSSQKLNCLFWDWVHSGYGDNDEKLQELYKNICKLAVLSGIEIDKAKRSFPNVNVAAENTKIANADRYSKQDDKGKPAFPEFFKEIHKEAPKQDPERERSYTFYNAPMEYIYKSVLDIDFRQGRVGRKEYRPICSLLKKPEGKISSTVYDHKNKIIEICEEYQQELKHLYNLLRKAEEDERELIYERIKLTKNERNAKVEKLLTEERVLYLVIKELDKGTGENWHLYAPLLGTEMFEKMLSGNKKVMQNVTKKIDGEIDLFGLKFTKI
jgi:hypothetical protein